MALRVERIFLATGIAVTALLLWASMESVIWEALLQPGLSYSSWHYAAHFFAYAILAAAWVLGLPRVNVTHVTLAVVAFGFAQEAIEMVGHTHAFELADAYIDAGGAILGAAAVSSLRSGRRLRGSSS